MGLLLRRIRRDKWLPPEDVTWVPEGDIPADPLADLGTTQGKLSIWLVDESRSNLDRVLCALAGNCRYLSHVDYLLFDDSVLGEVQLKVEHAQGNTPDSEANAKWHRDIVEMSAGRLASLARRMYSIPHSRRHRNDVRKLLKEALQNSWLNVSKMEKNLLSELGLPGPS